MFFTRIGMIIAHLIFWLSLFQIGAGFFVAFGTADIESNRALARLLLGTKTSGEAIDNAGLRILVAVALGVICEISLRRSHPIDQA